MKLIFIKGCSGSGKSHLANQLYDKYKKEGLKTIVLSSDDQITCRNGEYLWTGDIARLSHQLLDLKLEYVMQEKYNVVIIDNMNLRWQTVQPRAYVGLKHGYDISIVETSTWWRSNPDELFRRSQHNVPLEQIKKFVAAEEDLDYMLKKLEEVKGRV